MKKLLGGSLETCQEWSFLIEAFKIRNALLHANGRPALMNEKDREEIQRIVVKHKDLFHWPEKRVPDQSGKLKKSKDTWIKILPAGVRKISMSIQQLISQLRPSN